MGKSRKLRRCFQISNWPSLTPECISAGKPVSQLTGSCTAVSTFPLQGFCSVHFSATVHQRNVWRMSAARHSFPCNVQRLAQITAFPLVCFVDGHFYKPAISSYMREKCICLNASVVNSTRSSTNNLTSLEAINANLKLSVNHRVDVN